MHCMPRQKCFPEGRKCSSDNRWGEDISRRKRVWKSFWKHAAKEYFLVLQGEGEAVYEHRVQWERLNLSSSQSLNSKRLGTRHSPNNKPSQLWWWELTTWAEHPGWMQAPFPTAKFHRFSMSLFWEESWDEHLFLDHRLLVKELGMRTLPKACAVSFYTQVSTK